MKPRMLILILFLAGVIAGMSGCSKESDKSNTIKITSVHPSSPADMPFGEYVLVRYDYKINHPDGARMWVIPYTNGDKTPGYLYSSSKVYHGIGSREVGFSVKQGDKPVMVDQLRIVMDTPDQEQNLYEDYMDVRFTFK